MEQGLIMGKGDMSNKAESKKVKLGIEALKLEKQNLEIEQMSSGNSKNKKIEELDISNEKIQQIEDGLIGFGVSESEVMEMYDNLSEETAEKKINEVISALSAMLPVEEIEGIQNDVKNGIFNSLKDAVARAGLPKRILIGIIAASIFVSVSGSAVAHSAEQGMQNESNVNGQDVEQMARTMGISALEQWLEDQKMKQGEQETHLDIDIEDFVDVINAQELRENISELYVNFLKSKYGSQYEKHINRSDIFKLFRVSLSDELFSERASKLGNDKISMTANILSGMEKDVENKKLQL